MSFEPLGLTPELLRAVADQGYTEPTAVQAEAIPLVLEGRDVLAGAQTGTGKTAAFVLPILQRLARRARPAGRPRRPSGIRRPAAHDRRDARAPADPLPDPHPDPRARAPGRGERPDLRRPATRPLDRRSTAASASTPRSARSGPARRSSSRRRAGCSTTSARARSTCPGSRSSSSTRPTGCSTWASSATSAGSSRSSRRGARTSCSPRPSRPRSGASPTASSTDPAQVQVTPRNTTVELVRQVVHPVDRERKRELLSHLIRTGRIDQALVFTRTKHGANRLAEQLGRDGIAAAAIHGNRSQAQRVRALADFKAGRVAILVATDIAARGIDIDGLPHVVNFELPMTRRGLRPPDRADRPGRARRRRGLARLRRRVEAAVADRGAPPDEAPRRGRRRVRARPIDPPRADPAPPGRRAAHARRWVSRTGPGGRAAASRRRVAPPAGPDGRRIPPSAPPGVVGRPTSTHGLRTSTRGRRTITPGPPSGGDPARRQRTDHRPIVTLPGERLAQAAPRSTDDRPRR